MPLRSLEKRAVDELIQQLLGKIGDARVVGPNAPLTVLDAHYVGPLPCNRGGLCGLRFLVLGKDHIVDVFGAQLADGSRVEGAEEPYGAGLARPVRSRVPKSSPGREPSTRRAPCELQNRMGAKNVALVTTVFSPSSHQVLASGGR